MTQILTSKNAICIVTEDGVARIQKIDSNNKFVGNSTKVDIK